MKKTELSYNGWANYETWTVSIWEWFEPMAESAMDQGDLQVDASWCEDWLYDALEINDYRGNIVGDWVSMSFREIDFREIAKSVNEVILDMGI